MRTRVFHGADERSGEPKMANTKVSMLLGEAKTYTHVGVGEDDSKP